MKTATPAVPTTDIECSNCKDVISVFGPETIQLPFVCAFCQNAAEPQPTVEGEIAAMVDSDEGCGDPDCPNCNPTEETETGEPDHDAATVENTNLLIADLEQQIATAKTKYAELKTATIDLAKESVKLASYYRSLKHELGLSHAAEELSHVALAKSLGKVNTLQGQIVGLELLNVSMTKALAEANKKISYQDVTIRLKKDSARFWEDLYEKTNNLYYKKKRQLDTYKLLTGTFRDRLRNLFRGYVVAE